MSGEPIESTLQVVGEARALATMANPPEAVIAEAQAAAAALKDVLSRKPKPVMMGGEQYLEFEDWQTLGRFYAVTAGEESEPEYVTFPSPGGFKDISGFKATSVALRNGEVISRATAFCMNDEEKWSSRTKYVYAYVKKSGGTSVEDPGFDELTWEDNPFKEGKKRPVKVREEAGVETVPLYQLASMAQTRANAKVLRNVLSWVAVLAGYKPTPAEELQDKTDPPEAKAPEAAPPKRGRKPHDNLDGTPPVPPSESIACPYCGSADFVVSKDEATAVCAQKECSKGWSLGR